MSLLKLGNSLGLSLLALNPQQKMPTSALVMMGEYERKFHEELEQKVGILRKFGCKVKIRPDISTFSFSEESLKEAVEYALLHPGFVENLKKEVYKYVVFEEDAAPAASAAAVFPRIAGAGSSSKSSGPAAGRTAAAAAAAAE